jgi:hypothetical protein
MSPVSWEPASQRAVGRRIARQVEHTWQDQHTALRRRSHLQAMEASQAWSPLL